MNKSQLEFNVNSYARKYSYAGQNKTFGPEQTKGFQDKSRALKFRLKCSQQNLVTLTEIQKEQSQNDKRKLRRLSESKIYYSRKSSEESSISLSDSFCSNDRKSSITSLGYQITSYLGLSHQVRSGSVELVENQLLPPKPNICTLSF